MFSLIIIVIAIGLMAALAAATMNYMPADAHQRQLMYKEADKGIKALDCAVTRYLDSLRLAPGEPINPPAPGDVKTAVTPYYGFLPAPVRKEMTWEITSGELSGAGPAVGICLRPINASSPMQREVLGKLQSQLPVGSTFVGAACNATADATDGAYLTYWVPVAHVN